MWDERYSTNEYVYGKDPNGFLEQVISDAAPGRALDLGAGEGRNSTFLAEHGFEVTAVDGSSVGLSKARELAAERGVGLVTVHTDLKHFVIEEGYWDTIISFFCHLPPPLRREMHERVVKGLRSGGTYIMELFSPRQLQYGTGGPRSLELLAELDDVKQELEGLDFRIAREVVRPNRSGSAHTGDAAVVQILGVKPGSNT